MTASSSALHDRHVLVIENDYMIAQETAEMLFAVGAKVLGPVPSLDAALHLVEAEERIDCVVLDVKLRDAACWSLVDVLLTRGVFVVLATGYSVDVLPRAYAHLPHCEKPVSSEDLTRALVQLLPDAGTPQEAAL